MSRKSVAARVRRASGRLVVGAAALLLAGTGCASSAGSPAAGGPSEPADPVVEPGGATPGVELAAAALYREATEAAEREQWVEAASLARAAVDRYPRAGVSGRALRLLAEAAFEAGRYAEAEAAADRYVSLLTPDHGRLDAMQRLAAEAAAADGRPGDALERALEAPGAAADRDGRWLRLVRVALDEAPDSVVSGLVVRYRDVPRYGPAVLARHAENLQSRGEDADARAQAEQAIAAGAEGPDRTLADRVLEGAYLPVVPVVRLSAVLPRTGSPALQSFSDLVAEGVEVALAAAGDLEVVLDTLDDQGDAAAAAAAIRSLDEGALGAVGFLEDHVLQAAGDAREGPLPLVSPTARTGMAAGTGAYSLAGPDPEAARAVAEYARGAGYRRVALLHAMTPGSSEEADAFAAHARALGMEVSARQAYTAGATFFQEQIRAVREALRLGEIRALGEARADTLPVDVAGLDPVALFMPIPPEDVELLAPQVTFFGLDTLGIDVLGTSGWTDARVLEEVDRRHTDGVVATAPVSGGPGSPGYARFRDAYEQHFRRSLVSPIPALGYDATLVLLEAVRRGGGSRLAVQNALQELDGVEGATGTFSVREGRLVRDQQVVRIMGRTLVPAG